MENLPQWTTVARLLRPQGRRGELLADPLTDLPSLFIAGRRVTIAGLAPPSDLTLETTIEAHWLPTGRNAGRIVLKLAGCDRITEAERLAGHDLLMLAADLPELAPDTWYVRDLLGCTLFDGPTAVGEITGVRYPVAPDGRTRLPDAAHLLEIALPQQPNPEVPGQLAGPGTEPALVPFVRAWLETVDLTARKVVMHLPSGLLTLDSASAPPTSESLD
jgi:16S rRNA processing protein RimM